MSFQRQSLPVLQERPAAFHVLANPIGSLCNLDCKYCYYLEKENLYPGQRTGVMSDEVLTLFVEQYIQSQSGSEVHFLWQGGEPTLAGLDFFERAIQLQQKYSDGRIIHNALQTNATTLDDHFCRFLKQHDFLLGVSVDGPKHLHDAYRVNKGGQPTYDQVMNGLNCLKSHGVRFNLLCVVHRENSLHPIEVYESLKEIGGTHLQFLPLVEQISRATDRGIRLTTPDHQVESDPMEGNVSPSSYGQFLIEIFDHWFRQDVGKVFVQIFDVTLENWLGLEPSLCIFRETCGDAVALEKSGDVYSCDHYVFPEYLVGNIRSDSLHSIVSSPRQRAFGLDKKSRLPRQCRECEVYFACKGECPKNRFMKTSDGEAGLNYLCEGYLAFFRHVAPQMNQMAATIQPGITPRKLAGY